jgi:hypothetical protein
MFIAKSFAHRVITITALASFILAARPGIADITNWENNPMNYQNNPMNYNSDRIVRDNSGHAMGYAVPKPDSGVNYFDMQGHREGYQGPGSRW